MGSSWKSVIALLFVLGYMAQAQTHEAQHQVINCTIDSVDGHVQCNSTPFLLTRPLLNAPEPKKPVHSFIDNTNLAVFSSSATALTAEAQMSCNVPGTVCKQVTVGAAGFFVAEVATAAVLHKTNHHTLERNVGLLTTLFHVTRIAWISTHRK